MLILTTKILPFRKRHLGANYKAKNSPQILLLHQTWNFFHTDRAQIKEHMTENANFPGSSCVIHRFTRTVAHRWHSCFSRRALVCSLLTVLHFCVTKIRCLQLTNIYVQVYFHFRLFWSHNFCEFRHVSYPMAVQQNPSNISLTHFPIIAKNE